MTRAWRALARALLVGWCVIVLGWGGASGVHAQTQRVLSLQEYHDQLIDALAAMKNALNPRSELSRVQTTLATIDAVQFPSGVVVSITPLLGGVTDPAVAQARLQTVVTQIEFSANDNLDARLKLLDEVWARPEFNQPESWWDRFWRWFEEWWNSLFPNQPQSDAVTEVTDATAALINWGIVIVGGVLLALLLSYWLSNLFGDMVAEAELRRRQESGEEEPLTAEAARRQASSLAQAGDYRQAVRRLYLSALLTLEERRLISLDRSWTNRELLEHTVHNRSLQSHLQPVVETFDDVWYGVHEPDAGTFTSYEAAIDELGEVVAQAPEKKPEKKQP